MILFYTGSFWEQFDHDDRIHDEIETYERVAEHSSVLQVSFCNNCNSEVEPIPLGHMCPNCACDM